MDVGGWLRSLGLEHYEGHFRENKIDVDVLPRLTADDLKDIGVSAVGDRRRLLDAIATLAGTISAEASGRAPQCARPKSPQLEAERRPITVLFCDLVGSTSLAAKLDAEDWRNLVNAYLDEASTAVTGLGGHVLKKLGDGLMALFGYPKAQENDAERAVRAALAIQRALGELNAGNARSGAPELAARIGLESGHVVVDSTGEVFGEAPNVAARVQAAAEPGAVLITMNVQRQVAGLFVVEEKGAHELKGVAQPLSLYRVVRASGGGRRGGGRALTSFVGREEDIGTLLRRWDRVRAGEGQFVQIVGEPGLGKSRLVEEFHSRLGETPHTWVEWNSSQLLQNTPLHPVAEWGRARFGGQDVAAERRLADLETTLAQVKLDLQETATLLAPLLDIPLPTERAPKFGPEELRGRQLAAMVALLLAGARTQPVVLAFEDLHWADPTSLDLIQALAERGAQAPLLVVATTRPEFRAPWGMRSHHAVVALAPLDGNEVRRMVGDIAAQHALPHDVIEKVSERTGGVPLFVEEVTRLLVERGEQGGVQTIPPTLQQSLAARLDRLGPAREVAQIGAVLGRNFVYAMLRDVAEIDEPALQASLNRLADADLLFVEGAPPEANYRFKHALIQDAAYDSLLKSRRQALHRRAAEALVEAKSQPEAIAHHFTQAGLDELAIEWWGKAGDQALRRSAFQEAIAHLGKAIEMADKATTFALRGGAEDVATSNQRAKLQSDYSQAMMWSKGYATEETKAALARAAQLAERTDDFSGRFNALSGQFAAAATRGELRSARELALTLLRKAEDARRVAEAGMANFMLGLIDYWHGDFVEARAHCERALDARDPNPDPKVRERDRSSIALSFLAAIMWQLGEVERAGELINSATQRASETGHSGAIADALFWKSYLEIWRGDPLTTLSAAEALETLAREHAMIQFVSEAELHSGWARGRINDPIAGAAQVRRVLAAFVDQGVRVNLGFYSGLLAQLEAQTLGANSALSRIDEAFRLSNAVEHGCSLPFLHRLRGEILLKRDPADLGPAEEAFRTSIAIAKDQGARSPVLLASLALAKLYQSTGRPVEANAVLWPALEGFVPTPEMPEIAEAQALVGALAEREEVKATEARRQRRLHLQTAYGQAMMWAKGFAAEETEAAFSRAMEITAKTDDFEERFATGHFQWTLAFLRGELRSARELVLSLLKEAENTGRAVEAGVARRGLTLACYQAGDFLEARIHCERTLEDCNPERERETQERFHDATGPIVMSVLGVTMWQLGEVGRARELIDEAIRRASELGHAPSIAHPLFWKSHLEILRGDAAAALSSAEALEKFGREQAMPFWRAVAELSAGWARGRLHDAAAGAADLRRALAERIDQGATGDAWFGNALLAELEAETLGADSALARIDEAMALARQVEIRSNLPFLFLLRGELLLKRDPSNQGPAEEAFQTALEIAKQQGARSWGLRAALALARLYQSTDRPLDAHAVLSPALDGFSPTPEMPEIAEAQPVLAGLAQATA
jgi:class 3 adenylate cyclase/tetratricopeptide (TPR) repeat protein